MTGLLLRLAAAATLVLAAAAGAPAGPAAAAPCSPGAGVTVVVDFHQLGGGVVSACDGSGDGKTAVELFEDNGFSLAYVQRQPGFVCRVDGKPGSDAEACVSTPPADAYWGLFWADGASTAWKYSTTGAGSLTLRDGQSVAFSWQGSSSDAPPRLRPPVAGAPSPTPSPSASRTPPPTPSPTPAPTPSATPGPTSTTSSAEGASTAAPEDRRSRSRERETRDPSPTAAAVAAGESTGPGTSPAPASARGEDRGRLPGWALPAVLAGLLLTGGATAYARRRIGDRNT